MFSFNTGKHFINNCNNQHLNHVVSTKESMFVCVFVEKISFIIDALSSIKFISLFRKIPSYCSQVPLFGFVCYFTLILHYLFISSSYVFLFFFLFMYLFICVYLLVLPMNVADDLIKCFKFLLLWQHYSYVSA